MKDAIKLVRNSINLDAYGSSSGFLGYFERAGQYSAGMAEAAVGFFCDFYAEWLDDAVMVSSMHINSDELGRCGDSLENERDLLLVQSLGSSAEIPVVSYNEQFGNDYSSKEYDAAIDAVWNTFKVSRVKDYDPTTFRSLLLSRLLVYGVHGHCFLIFENLGFACYPSDDIGFGAVALGDVADISTAHEFLRRGGALKGFRSVIEK